MAAAALFACGATAAIQFDDFDGDATQALSFAGNARIAGHALRLTRAYHDQSGAVWFREKQPVSAGFETTFQFQLTKQGGLGHGADGFAFVLQNSGPDALGGRGSAGGFAVADKTYGFREKAIPWSIAVFFDTYRNDEEHDPSNNYVSFCTYGRPADMRWPANRLAFTRDLTVRLKDRQVHTARIVFRPAVLSVFLDGSDVLALQAPVDLSVVVDSHGSAWVGFTASTGGGWENHDILNWSFHGVAVDSSISMVDSDISFSLTACLPDRNLCTPERPIVERNGAAYHIVLPANVEWGARIPNATGREVDISNAHGIVCWDAKARGADGCSGPSGSGTPAGPGFLSSTAAPGALIRETRGGETRFSVNARTTGFGEGQGFYEFDVAIR